MGWTLGQGPGVVPSRVAGQGTYMPGGSFPCRVQLDFLSAAYASGRPTPDPVAEPGWQLVVPQ